MSALDGRPEFLISPPGSGVEYAEFAVVNGEMPWS
jgi:hypothetical protein